jgi:hypothetical protein
VFRAIVCLAAFLAGAVPMPVHAQNVVGLLNAQTCAARATEMVAVVTPAPTASPSPGPAVAPAPLTPGQLYATPFPRSSPVTPPPIPTPTPAPKVSAGPVYIVHPSGTPSVVPAGSPTPASSPRPIAAPTLRPGYSAIIADKFVGNMLKPNAPGDAIGHVNIFYQDEILVGDRAHWDGIRTVTISGNPYIINNTNTSTYHAEVIKFDALTQQAELVNGHGESSQGVERGLIYFSAKDLKSDEHGVAHGDYANVTTCERPRAGYHLTGRTMDVFPGDRLVISKAVLWLGAAAVFYLPKVIIPLRRIDDERQRPSFFPEVGYNSYQGLYLKAKPAFGRDQYYYGYYRVEYYTRTGWALGYTGFLTPKSGKRQSSLDFYLVRDRRLQKPNYNINALDTENFSRNLRGRFGFTYNSNFGPLINLPPNQSVNAQINRTGATSSQGYSFARSAIQGQSNTDNFGFTDTRVYGAAVTNSFNMNLTRSHTSYGTDNISNSSAATVNDLFHWSNRVADYTLTFDKEFTKTPSRLNREPELQIRPRAFLPRFIFPVTSSLTIGNYNEPQTPLSTSRADLNVSVGPALYRFLGSDFSATLNVHQFAYGTGDMKASVSQNMTLSTPIGNHVVNSITYTENNYNGPPTLPFSQLDLQSSLNYKNAADVLRFFNGEYYNFALNFGTSFNRQAQPVQYQLTLRPSRRSYVALGGAFTPGSGQGFYQTNVQFSTPFGRGSTLQFIGDIDWKNKARIINKSIWYSHIIGDCYVIQVQYNQAARQVNVTLNLLAFPSHGATFGLNTSGSIIPTSLNF